MGILRAVLAISVVFAHSNWRGGAVFAGGQAAVQCFYIISGYLISYILLNNKSYTNLWRFYGNRALRIYPAYLAVALLSLPIGLLGKAGIVETFRSAPAAANILLAFSNIFLFGQDWVFFSGVRGGHLVFASNFNHSEVVLCRGLLLPQSWTLGVELTFYLLAPFILKDRRKLMVLLLASFGLRACLLMQGIGFSDPWSCRFFPSELGLFLLGALSQQLLSPLWKRAVAKVKKLPHWGTGVLVCFTVAFCGIPLPYEIVLPVFLASAALLMPLTFFFQNSFAMDKWIGELSYPIYIGHILAFHLLNPLLHTLRIQNNVLIANANVAASILLAIILNHFLIRRLDALRERLRSASGKQRRANSEVCA